MTFFPVPMLVGNIRDRENQEASKIIRQSKIDCIHYYII